MQPTIDRGELITEPASNGGEYHRYKNTVSGVSPRAIPGTQGYIHVVATDEHDEDSGLISDEFTNPHKRRAMSRSGPASSNGSPDRIAPPSSKATPTPTSRWSAGAPPTQPSTTPSTCWPPRASRRTTSR